MRKLSRRAKILLSIGAGLVIAGLSGFIAISQLEERDQFCTSCHTVPEVTYNNRAQASLSGELPHADLSSAHFVLDPAALPSGELFRCIDCHRGNGSLPHRLTAISLGARDAAIYLLRAEDPAIEKTDIEVSWLLTQSCTTCHNDSLLVAGFENHFHNKLPDAFRAWRAGGELTLPENEPEANRFALEAGLKKYDTGIRCLDCHLAHFDVEGSELFFYLDVENVVLFACEQCHRDVDAGPLDLVAEQATDS